MLTDYESWEDLQKNISLYMEVEDIIFYYGLTLEIGKIREHSVFCLGGSDHTIASRENRTKYGHFVVEPVGKSRIYFSMEAILEGITDGNFKNMSRIRRSNLHVFHLI